MTTPHTEYEEPTLPSSPTTGRVPIFVYLWCALLTLLGAYLLLNVTGSARERELLRTELAAKHTALSEVASSTSAYQAAQNVQLSDTLYRLESRILEIEEEVGGFDSKVGRIRGTVDELRKLQEMDPQLLQKYSKVYFLNEHYQPTDLVVIDEAYDVVDGKQVTVHADMWPFLERLLKAAEKKDLSLRVLSGYRSFAEQTTLKQSYGVQYGTGANQFSADQGYSEHQLGTTVDFTTEERGGNLDGFETTPEYAWLIKNAHRYGFTLSYPPGNQYYVFEPWHWRFVGEELADDLKDQSRFFYDMEQRELDRYLPSLFD